MHSLPELMELPSASIVLLAYNQEKFVREAALAALSQEGDPIEVLLSDDNSSDQSYEILLDVAKSYTGKHKIILNRNAKNLGIMAHFKRAVSLTTGDWIVAAAGDDVSSNARVRTLMETAARFPHLAGIASHFHEILPDGQLRDVPLDENRRMQAMQDWPMERVMSSMRRVGCGYFLLGAAAAWHRSTLDSFPALPEDKDINEDYILMWRAMMLGGTRILEQDLVGYRKHSASLSATMPSEMGEKVAYEQRVKRLWRSRRSFLFTIQDLDYALGAGKISKDAYAKCINSLLDYVCYQSELISWRDKTLIGRLDSLLRFWRPGLLRPGIRDLFAPGQRA